MHAIIIAEHSNSSLIRSHHTSPGRIDSEDDETKIATPGNAALNSRWRRATYSLSTAEWLRNTEPLTVVMVGLRAE
jgi:hypothetical protein